MKRIVFLIIGTLLVLGLVLPGCGGPATPEITIAICGPMTNVQGVHMWNGAVLARDEINDTGGIMVGATAYNIKLVKVNTNEIASPASAGPAMEGAITSQKAQFVIGGFRTEAVVDMVKVAGNTTTPFFICGAATYTLLSGAGHSYTTHAGTPYYPYEPASAGYKYIFRATPFNDVFLVNNCFLMATMVAKQIETIIGANTTNRVKFAILSESLTWADAMTESARLILGTVAPYVFGWNWQLAPGGNNGTGVWRVSDNPTTEVMSNILNAIKTSGAHIIFTILSGPVGVTYGKLKGQLDVPAISVGINVEGQDPGYWAKTQYASGPAKYGAEYEITMGTWAPGVNITSKTASFLERYTTATGGLDPLYTASSCEMIYTLKAALEAVDIIEEYDVVPDPDQDAVIAWLENPANAQLISTGTSAYYQLWNGVTKGAWKSGTSAVWPALNATQRDVWYSTLGFYASCNFTMPPYTTHDLVYGPGWLTGIAIQWQETGGGSQIGVWPNNATWLQQNAMSRVVAGINWTNVEYPGTSDFSIPAWMITEWTT